MREICFTGDALIITEKGLKRIDEITLEDKVLTHNNRYQKVINIENSNLQNMYSLKLRGLPSFYVTKDHLFLTTEVKMRYNRDEQKKEFYLDEKSWKKTSELTDSNFLALPFNDFLINDIGISVNDAWLLGKFFAKGFVINEDNKTTLCIEETKTKYEEYKTKLDNSYKMKFGTNNKLKNIYITGPKIDKIYKELDQKNHQKEIPSQFLNLPIHILKEMINGFLSEKGNKISEKGYEMELFSKKLTYQIGQIISKTYKVHYSIEEKRFDLKDKNVPSHKKRIFKLIFDENIKGIVIRKNIIWHKIDYIKEISFENIKVFNLEVEEDNSYICNNIIVGDSTMEV